MNSLWDVEFAGIGKSCKQCNAPAVHKITTKDDGRESYWCDECCFCGYGDHIIVVNEVRHD
jgi:transposase-like protein